MGVLNFLTGTAGYTAILAAFGLAVAAHFFAPRAWSALAWTIAFGVLGAAFVGQREITAGVQVKLAQAEYLTGLHGAPPILLIDDIMGELDAKRRGGFLPLLDRAEQSRGQVFMTATEANWPVETGRTARRWLVKEGTLLSLPA